MRFELLPPVPAVTLSRKLREIPLFRFASVDELFRISRISRQARYEKGASVQRRGAPAEYIQILVQGRIRVAAAEGGGASDELLSPPAMFGFREALEGTTLRQEASADTEAIALVMAAEEFRTLLSANIELAEGLFRMLLGPSDDDAPLPALAMIDATAPGAAAPDDPMDGDPLNAADKALRLQAIPILSRATGEELYEVALISREERRAPGEILFSEGGSPSILLPLAGRIGLESPDGAWKRTAGPGQCLGVRETLAGTSWSFRARTETSVHALVVDRETLFDLLADRAHLLQCIFSSVFRNNELAEAQAS